MHFMHALDKMEDDDIGDISKIKIKRMMHTASGCMYTLSGLETNRFGSIETDFSKYLQ